MKKIIASAALVAFIFAVSAPTFASANYDKDPKAAKTETKKDDKKSCSKDGKCCKDKSASSEKKADATKK